MKPLNVDNYQVQDEEIIVHPPELVGHKDHPSIQCTARVAGTLIIDGVTYDFDDVITLKLKQRIRQSK